MGADACSNSRGFRPLFDPVLDLTGESLAPPAALEERGLVEPPHDADGRAARMTRAASITLTVSSHRA
jgi:hypothetical protein